MSFFELLIIFPFTLHSEIAVEEAVRLKEKHSGAEVTVVSIGPKAAQETLRSALAMGADKAIHIQTSQRTDQELQPLAVAKLLASIALREKVSLFLLGKQSIDGDNCQTGPMLAGLLSWPQVTFAAKVDVKIGGEVSEAVVERETDAGTEVYRAPLPCVLTADLRLNEPRYATLPNIMKAKKKPLEVIEASSLGVDTAARNLVLAVSDPPARPQGSLVDSTDALIGKIKDLKLGNQT